MKRFVLRGSVNNIRSVALCILLISSTLFSQSVTGSFFSNGGTTSSNESFSSYSTLGETFVGAGSNETYNVFGGSQFVKNNLVTGIGQFENSSLPERYLLSQNYPNPFNPSTTIRFDLPKPTNVTLRIFNTLGQEVAVLVNQEKAAGYHQVRWEAFLPSGIYFYRLQAGSFVDTKKLILMK